jgi:hypothetical protein
MTTENLNTIRKAVSGAGDSLLVLVVPVSRVRDLFDGSAPAHPVYTADLTVPHYREQFEPDLSDSRIRELCAAKVFPDTTTEDGRVVPGAYKDSGGNWRITREGIVARQTYERADGLRKRAEAETAKAEGDVVPIADEANNRYERTREKGRRSSSERSSGGAAVSKRAARPNRGNWKNLIGEGGAGT